VLCLCGAIGLIASPAWAQDSQSRFTRIGQSWVDFYSSHDITRISDVFTNDIVWEEVPSASRRSQPMSRGSSTTFSSPGSSWSGPPVTAIETSRGVAVLEIRGHKIARNTDYWDLFSDLRRLLPDSRECVLRLLGLDQ
jgi:hypothetical protein